MNNIEIMNIMKYFSFSLLGMLLLCMVVYAIVLFFYTLIKIAEVKLEKKY